MKRLLQQSGRRQVGSAPLRVVVQRLLEHVGRTGEALEAQLPGDLPWLPGRAWMAHDELMEGDRRERVPIRLRA